MCFHGLVSLYQRDDMIIETWAPCCLRVELTWRKRK